MQGEMPQLAPWKQELVHDVLQHNILVFFGLSSLLVAWLVWLFYRWYLLPIRCPDDVPELVYWIPCKQRAYP